MEAKRLNASNDFLVAGTAEAVHGLFAEFLSTGNLHALVSLYDEDSTLMLANGGVLQGKPAIAAHFAGLLSASPRMTIEAPQVLKVPGLAVLIARWNLTGTAADGSSFAETGCTYDVVRQQPDGSWRIVFDSPWGGARP